MDTTAGNRNKSPTASQQKIFVPAPHKVKVHLPHAPTTPDLEQLIEIEKRKIRGEILRELDKSISAPLQALFSMAEFENRDDYRRQIERILNVIRDLQANPGQ